VADWGVVCLLAA